LPATGRGWQIEGGNLGIWLPGKDLLVVQIAGHGGEEFVTPIGQAFDQALESSGSVRMYFDVGKLHKYDSPLRTRLTTRFLRDRGRIAGIDILVQSKIVSMGVAVANLALGGLIKSYARRPDFDSALDDALKGAGVATFSSRVLSAA
jgi:hypothetical protein